MPIIPNASLWINYWFNDSLVKKKKGKSVYILVSVYEKKKAEICILIYQYTVHW